VTVDGAVKIARGIAAEVVEHANPSGLLAAGTIGGSDSIIS
jgi:hypothetical protein